MERLLVELFASFEVKIRRKGRKGERGKTGMSRKHDNLGVFRRRKMESEREREREWQIKTSHEILLMS